MDNDQLNKLRADIDQILARNQKVENEKKWETSVARKCSVALITYITMLLLLLTLDHPNPFSGAIVPTTGYVLSTLSLPWFKRRWLRNNGF